MSLPDVAGRRAAAADGPGADSALSRAAPRQRAGHHRGRRGGPCRPAWIAADGVRGAARAPGAHRQTPRARGHDRRPAMDRRGQPRAPRRFAAAAMGAIRAGDPDVSLGRNTVAAVPTAAPRESGRRPPRSSRSTRLPTSRRATLALRLLDPATPDAERAAEAIAREADGNPFLIEQLAACYRTVALPAPRASPSARCSRSVLPILPERRSPRPGRACRRARPTDPDLAASAVGASAACVL